MVIGAGIVGASAALELARAGHSVTVIERHPGAGLGSTRFSSTVIRCHYTNPTAIRMALEGQRIWQNWRDYVGLSRPRARYVQTGVLFVLRRGLSKRGGLGIKAEVSPRDAASIPAMMRRSGVKVEVLDARGMQRRFPQFHVPPDEPLAAVYEPEGGYVAYPREAVLDLVAAARKAGVRFLFGTELLEVRSEWDGERRRVRGVSISKAGRTRLLEADAVVNCGGPDSAEVNRRADSPLPTTLVPLRQVVIEAEYDGPALPTMADLSAGFYIRPDRRHFKLGAILPVHHVDFGAVAAPVREVKRDLLTRLAGRIPGAKLRNLKVQTAWYDWTVLDSYPVIDRTEVEGYVVAAGTSGAWFKSGPVIGRMAAALVAGAKTCALRYSGTHLGLDVFTRQRAAL